jgi:5-(carboxyamino)imidazole ribonucleotide mutase
MWQSGWRRTPRPPFSRKGAPVLNGARRYSAALGGSPLAGAGPLPIIRAFVFRAHRPISEELFVAAKPVAIIMGSQSDWATMKHSAEMLDTLGIGYEARIVSAHRTPDRLYAFAKGAKAAGFQVIIAGAGGAAHLPGMTAAMTTLPVFGVPVESKALSGLDSLYSIVQMPPGIPVGTLAIGRAGAVNAALIAAGVLALSDPLVSDRLEAWRKRQTDGVADVPSNEGGA